MSYPRLAGHAYRLTPENLGDPYEWRHTALVTRRPHRRVAKMRAYLTRVPLGPPPLYAASHVVDVADEAHMRRWLDGYAAALRRRRLDGTIDVRLVDDLDRGTVLIAERRPPREGT